MKTPLIIISLAIICCATLHARLVRIWTHSQLAEASHTIAVIEAVSTEKTVAPLPQGFPEAADNYQAWITTFKVHVGLKGGLDSTKPLKVLHWTYSEKKNFIANGAAFMRFTIGPVKREVTLVYDGVGRGTSMQNDYHPVWLAYLIMSREEGVFEPAAGQYDAAPAFKELSDFNMH
ncbi:hypothetical protein [Prosthecobacter sp.]|uniref:hypothetical protein n=1 Tax=Prosthecobacter sp. TaxID=1965333 RepID=UPI003783623D